VAKGVLAAAVVVLAAVTGTALARSKPSAAAPVAPGSALPQGVLALGVSASPTDLATGGWVPQSGVPWTYTYQYLAGGANTGSGWQSWNAQGQFPIYYAQAAHAQHAIPVFSYYMLLQSNGPCSGCGEAQKDLSHLDDPTTMASWYQDFATLMQRLGPGTYNGVTGYGGPVIVHVEPDLSGHAEQAVIDSTADCFGFCTGGGNNPANLGASVASSGVAAVGAFANTFQGFNDAILHLRDLYAPNVALGFHVSDWSTLDDVGSYPGSDVNFTTQGSLAGSFAAASGVVTSAPGVSTYDIVFNDVADNDAAKTGVWWDRTNRTFPDFTRWESYVAAVHAATGKGVIVWQVPLGNQWFDTENDTYGHYQDNRVEYFLAHPGELATAGIVGILFGAGNAGSTVQTDRDNDGITNSASFCTGDGMGGGTICNDHVSTVSDDDGGYLRMTAAAYYRAPTALPPAVGALRVVSSPAVPTQILVDGQISDSWGLAWLTLPAGTHTVGFTHVEGYSEPTARTVTVAAGATTTVTGTFTPRGSLRVATSPPVASEITLDGNPGDDWGVWTDLPAGSHQVCFEAVAGYEPPACQTATITAGTEADVTGTFTAAPGAPGQSGKGLLRVTTSPALPSQITLTPQGGGPAIADSWGLNWLELAPGTYVVTFGHVPGYAEPAPQTVTVTAGATTSVTATFTPRGSLRVTTTPAVDATITVDGNPTDNWGMWTDLPTGSHMVCFGPVIGYQTPVCQNATLSPGTETDVTGAYG
jgi:hypothetical protein